MKNKERRSGNDHRLGADRRKDNDPNYKDSEHRSGNERRSPGDRRSSVDCHTILADFLRID